MQITTNGTNVSRDDRKKCEMRELKKKIVKDIVYHVEDWPFKLKPDDIYVQDVSGLSNTSYRVKLNKDSD